MASIDAATKGTNMTSQSCIHRAAVAAIAVVTALSAGVTGNLALAAAAATLRQSSCAPRGCRVPAPRWCN